MGDSDKNCPESGALEICCGGPLFHEERQDISQVKSLSDLDSTVSIGGRPLCNLRFADDIDLIGRDDEELQDLTTRLEESAGKFGIEISAEKSKVLVNSNKDTPQTHIIMNVETLEQVDSF